VVLGKGLDTGFSAEGCSGVSGVGTDYFVFGDGYNNCCTSGLEILFGDIVHFGDIFFVLDEFLDGGFHFHHEFNMDEGLLQGFPNMTIF
jgi:hypothetical protein